MLSLEMNAIMIKQYIDFEFLSFHHRIISLSHCPKKLAKYDDNF